MKQYEYSAEFYNHSMGWMKIGGCWWDDVWEAKRHETAWLDDHFGRRTRIVRREVGEWEEVGNA